MCVRFVFRLTINKTSNNEHGTDTLKKLNNKVMLPGNVAALLPPDQIKCNILKGIHFKKINIMFSGAQC